MNQSLYGVPAALNADAYKSGHIRQYPDKSELMMFNMTARSDKYLNTPLAKNGIIPWGIRMFCQDYLVTHWNETFFSRPKDEVVAETMRIMNGVLGAGAVSPDHWAALHDLGYLPVCVDAVPEGTLLPIKVPMLNFQPTHRDFAWVAGYLEDAFSNELWKATCIATIAFHYRRIFEKWATDTCDNNFHVPYQGHDFALRGLSGMNDARNATGHLTSFLGTDDFAAVYTADRVYGDGLDVSKIGASIPATEHSVMVANIILKAKEMFGTLDATDEQRGEAEREVFRDFLSVKYPSGFISLVSDSFNYWRTIGTIARDLKNLIMAREGKIVFRPDSGNPYHVICGYEAIHFDDAKAIIKCRMFGDDYGQVALDTLASITKMSHLPHKHWITELGYDLIIDHETLDGADTLYLETMEERWMPTEEIRGSVVTLWETFGGTTNGKGYKELDPHVGLIYGDSITMELAETILGRLSVMGFASNNVVFGIGSYTYQMITRDTLGFAVKSTYIVVGGQHLMICKEPITDMGLKKSAKGCVVPVYNENGDIELLDQLTHDQYEDLVGEGQTLYQCVFNNSELFNTETNSLEKVRQRVDSYI